MPFLMHQTKIFWESESIELVLHGRSLTFVYMHELGLWEGGDATESFILFYLEATVFIRSSVDAVMENLW